MTRTGGLRAARLVETSRRAQLANRQEVVAYDHHTR
jgi:hypothetical protein